MQVRKTKTTRAALGLLLGSTLAASMASAQTQVQTQPPYPSSYSSSSSGPSSPSSRQVQARVTSVNQITGSDGRPAYNVTYEYDGRSYSMRSATYPGPTVAVEVNAYGVATLPVGESPSTTASTETVDSRSPWDRVVPEPGMVVSTSPAPAPAAYYAPPVYAVPPVYAAPPVYVPRPVYVQPGYGYGGYGGYGYGYGSPFYSPVGISLNLGYSRGWGGGHRHGGWRR